MRKIKIFRPHMEIRISVTDEMTADYQVCRQYAESDEDDERMESRCYRCSWDGAEWMDTDMCELDEMKMLMEEKIDPMVREKSRRKLSGRD